MKKIKRQIKRRTLNIVQCEGAICISVDGNDDRYYAEGVSSKVLEVTKIPIQITFSGLF